MKASKVRKKLLAGILCVSMLLHTVSVNVNADEADEIIRETQSVEVLAEEPQVQETKEPKNEAQESGAQSVEAEETGIQETDAGTQEIAEETVDGENVTTIETETAKTEVAETQEILETPAPEESETEAPEIKASETEEVSETELASEIDNLEETSGTNTESASELESGSEEIEEDVDMSVEFPDEVFRGKVFELLKVSHDSVVTKKMLGGLRTLDYPRTSVSEPVIKNIKGMELLTGLTEIDLSYHEISDARSIDWSSLSELTSINLNGNDIATAPNFYQNNKLRELQVKENLMDATQLRNLQSSGVPNQDVKLADDTLFSQRAEGFHAKVETSYYKVSSGVPVTVMVGGYKSKLPYRISFKLDGQDANFAHKTISGKTYENIYWIEKTGLSVGEHSVTIMLEQNGETLGELTRSFQVVEQDIYPGKSSYRYSTNSGDDVIDLYYTYSTTNTVDHITLTDENGKEFTYPNVSFRTSYESKDYRYQDIEGNYGLYMMPDYMNHTSFSMKDCIQVLPRGTYDINVFLKDGQTYCLEDLVRVTGGSVSDDWSCVVSKDEIYWNDNERNTTELSIINADENQTAKFELEGYSLSNAPVKVELKDTEPNKAVITASEGTDPNATDLSVTVKITVGSSVQRKEIKIRKRTYVDEFYVNGLKYDPKEIDKYVVELSGVDKSIDIKVTIGPEDAWEITEEFSVESLDPKVFVVERQTPFEKENEEGVKEKGILISIKSVGTGEAQLKVIYKDQESPKDGHDIRCTVKVGESNFSDLEKETLLKKVGTVYCITNVHGTRLGDLALPDGWEWVEPDTVVTVPNDDPSKVQGYSARYSQKSYVPFTMPVPVAVTQITGVKVSGPIELTSGKEGDYSVSLTYRGYFVESNKAFVEAVDKAVSFDWTADNIFVLDNRKGRNIKVQAAKVSDITAGVITANVTVGEEVLSEEYDVIVIPEHITQIKITPTTDKIQYPINYKYSEEENAVYVDEASVSSQAYRIKFVLSASMDDKEVEVQQGTFKWTINDPALGEIKEASDGTVQLYIKKSGTIILRATANDAGEKYAEIAVEVRDFSPILETNTIVLSKYALDGTELPIHAVEGNEIVSIRVNNENFKITRVDGKYIMSIVNKDSYTKNTTVNAQLTVRTQMGNPITWDVKLVVDTTKPKVRFVQKTAPNIFYADTIAQYVVNSDYDIASITNSADRAVGFSVESYDKETGILTVKAKGLDKSTVNGFQSKNSEYTNLPLLIKYNEYGTHTETLKITARAKKPTLKVQELAVLSAAQTMETYLVDTKTKKKVPLSETSKVTSLTPSVTAEQYGTNIKIGYSGGKSVSYKLSVSDENWTQDLNLSGKVSVVKALFTQLDTKKVSLNMAHNIKDNGSVSVDVSVKNNSSIGVETVRCDAANAKGKELVDSGYLKLSYDAAKGTLEIGLDENRPSGIRAGNYNFKVYATISGGTELKPATLGITLMDASKSPDVKLSGKGQINLVDRKNTSVLYTIKLSNMTSTVKSVKTMGNNAELFDASLTDDGKVEIKAAEGVSMGTTTYVLDLVFGFKNNTAVPASVRIKPVNKMPKMTASIKAGTIYKASNNEVNWRVYNSASFGEISDIVLPESKANQNFTIKKTGKNRITLKLTDEAKRTIKPGKYGVTYQVKLKDMASNAKPVTMKISITVK